MDSIPRGPARVGGGRAKAPRTQYLCSDCGDTFPQWYGRCPACQAWGTLAEFREAAAGKGERAGPGGSLLNVPASAQPKRASPGRGRSTAGRTPANPANPAPPALDATHAPDAASDAAPSADYGATCVVRLDSISLEQEPRLTTGIGEFDRILGGGLVPGSVVLLGGDPGIGKSTLLLQVAGALGAHGAGVLYASGEESAAQIRLRAERLPGVGGQLELLCESDLMQIGVAVGERAPDVLVVDSIQTAYLPEIPSAPGSVTQLRESALALVQLAKSRGMAVLLVGHVTKDGNLAGPKTLEHMVDTVLYMEGERYQHYRVLRSAKSRFGSVDEIGVFEMRDDGLREVPNPSQVFLSERTAGAVGSLVVACVEGTRALLIEVQALVHESRYSSPQRLSTGFDSRRLEILLAVLGKRGGLDISRHDVFVNVAGGLRVSDPGVDLGALLAIASSRRDQPPHPDLIALGEVGLAGEIRRVSYPERRVTEAGRLGYRRALLPEANARDLGRERDGVTIIGVATVVDAMHQGLQGGQDG